MVVGNIEMLRARTRAWFCILSKIGTTIDCPYLPQDTFSSVLSQKYCVSPNAVFSLGVRSEVCLTSLE